MGLDGMHPTLVGYALMAQEILISIQLHEGIAFNAPSTQAAYEADSLLQKVPIAWDIVLDLSLDIRRELPRGQAPTEMKYDAVSNFLGALQFKYD